MTRVDKRLLSKNIVFGRRCCGFAKTWNNLEACPIELILLSSFGKHARSFGLPLDDNKALLFGAEGRRLSSANRHTTHFCKRTMGWVGSGKKERTLFVRKRAECNLTVGGERGPAGHKNKRARILPRLRRLHFVRFLPSFAWLCPFSLISSFRKNDSCSPNWHLHDADLGRFRSFVFFPGIVLPKKQQAIERGRKTEVNSTVVYSVHWALMPKDGYFRHTPLPVFFISFLCVDRNSVCVIFCFDDKLREGSQQQRLKADKRPRKLSCVAQGRVKKKGRGRTCSATEQASLV